MAHLQIPTDLIQKLRPYYETEYEREQREERKRTVSDNSLVLRILQQLYDQKKKRPIN